jgi:arylsulfatase A-like enzyme
MLFVLLFACREERPAAETFERAPIIVISMYGSTRIATPNIDALRADGILYDNAYSHCPMTLPSHVSMLTGLLPTDHEVRNNLGYFDATKHPTLPQKLKERGYATGAAVSSSVLRAETGLGAAFDFYDDPLAGERSGRATLVAARQWIAQKQSQPFFFLFQIDEQAANVDAIAGELLAFLKKLGIYDRAIIVLTSDHGEGLGLSREVLHVPLILKLPQRARAGNAVRAPAALQDLAPTLLKLAGGKPDQGVDLLAPTLPQRRIYSESGELKSLIDYRHHYIQGTKDELYDIFNDPAETTDILSEERRVTASMREELAHQR